MILQRLQDSLGIKLAQGLCTITPNELIKVGDRQTEGPGEYDISGVGIHMNEHTAVLFTEGVRLGIVWPHEKVEFDGDTNVDILISFATDVKQITNLLKEQDPRILVLTDEAAAEEVAKQDGVAVTKEASYKVTAQSLPADDRVFVLLS